MKTEIFLQNYWVLRDCLFLRCKGEVKECLVAQALRHGILDIRGNEYFFSHVENDEFFIYCILGRLVIQSTVLLPKDERVLFSVKYSLSDEMKGSLGRHFKFYDSGDISDFQSNFFEELSRIAGKKINRGDYFFCDVLYIPRCEKTHLFLLQEGEKRIHVRFPLDRIEEIENGTIIGYGGDFFIPDKFASEVARYLDSNWSFYPLAQASAP